MTSAERRRDVLRSMVYELRNWRLDPVGRALEDALEEEGFIRLAHELRETAKIDQWLHDRQLEGWREGDEVLRAVNHDRSVVIGRKYNRLLGQALDAASAVGRDVWWWADTSGIVSGRQGRIVISFPVEIQRRNPGFLGAGGRWEKPTVHVELLGPAQNRDVGRFFLTKPEDVTLRPQTRLAPWTAGWLRR